MVQAFWASMQCQQGQWMVLGTRVLAMVKELFIQVVRAYYARLAHGSEKLSSPDIYKCVHGLCKDLRSSHLWYLWRWPCTHVESHFHNKHMAVGLREHSSPVEPCYHNRHRAALTEMFESADLLCISSHNVCKVDFYLTGNGGESTHITLPLTLEQRYRSRYGWLRSHFTGCASCK